MKLIYLQLLSQLGFVMYYTFQYKFIIMTSPMKYVGVVCDVSTLRYCTRTW